ncbi:MAG TPA: carboxypeptidase-like regulatory domain-containing protein [Pyrinomonadaceae bacterium]|nr:carboxypeptidase-like regulatory domain-containing protein [Pyrinomonadaceae bacterium]
MKFNRHPFISVLIFSVFSLLFAGSYDAFGQKQIQRKKVTPAPRILIKSRSSKQTNKKVIPRSDDGSKFVVRTGQPVTPSAYNGDARDLSDVVTEAERERFRLARPQGKKRPVFVKVPPTDKPVEPEAPVAPAAPMPTPLSSFNGMERLTNGSGWPPDTDGDVGYSHYIQAVNTSFRITDKSGTTLATSTFASLWTGAGTGTPCDTAHNGDPTVNFDPGTGRFVIADFSWSNLQNGPYYECIAVSKTSNPVTGGWWLYAIRADDAAHPWLPDYPKMGIWRDGLYMGTNMFDCLNATCSSATYMGARAYAFNFSKMINGTALTANDVQVSDLGSSRFSVFPANYRGTIPPVGTPQYFVGESGTVFAWEVFKFSVNFVTPASSTFTGPTNVSQTAYNVASGAIATPAGAGANIDTLADRVMKQVQYRNLSGAESLWVNHTTGTTTATTPVGIQWAQINVTGTTVNTTPVQQQIFNNGADGLHRFMGSLAVDKQGNMALGYTAANSTTHPDIRYSGRLAGDTLGTLPQTETSMLTGVTRNSQTSGGGGRWGDYSSMTVDPIDDCTFWYTQEYYAALGTNWQTRIGTFKFPTCLGPTASYAVIGGLVKSQNGNGIAGALVTVTNSNGETRTARTSSFGYFSIGGLEVGQTYTISVNAKRSSFNTRVVSLTDSIDDLEIIAN